MGRVTGKKTKRKKRRDVDHEAATRDTPSPSPPSSSPLAEGGPDTRASSAATTAGDGAQRLMVAMRCRPMLPHETSAKYTSIVRTIGDNGVALLDPHTNNGDVLRQHRSREKHYTFDIAFGEDAGQHNVYEKTCRTVVPDVIRGYNATVFAYGPTGAGKTYTMLGTDTRPGLMYLTLVDLFQQMKDEPDASFKVTMTYDARYVEIYNEVLYDLLVPNSAELDLREDASGNPVICGCRSIPIQSADQVMEWLSTGNRRRTQEATAANVTSSRSHALLEVKVERKESSVRQDISEEYTVGSLFMCDLAGSERAAQTKNTGQRMVEGQHINRSLLALGNCINSISAGDKYVNFRDSKLTRLLKEAFSGNSRTIMIAHVSPASFHFEESFNTLNYANRAKNIKTRTSKNVFSVQAHITEYAQIVEGLKLQVAQLKLELAQHEGQTRGPSAASRAGGPSAEGGAPRSHEDGGATGGPSEKDTSGKELRAQLRTAFAAQLEAQQRLLALQEENLALAVEMNDKTLTIEEWEQNRFLQVPLPSEGEDPLPVAAAREDMAVLVERSDGMLAKKAEVQEEVRGHRAAVDEMTQGLPERVTNKGRLRLLQSLQRIHDLEADKLQLRLAGKVSEVALASKDCIVERLLRQISFRDAVIAEQRKQLSASSVEPTDKLKQLYDGLKLQKAGRLTPLPGAASSSYPFSEVTSPLPVIGASAPPPVAEWENGGDGPVDLRSTFTVQDRAALPISPEFEPIPEELPAGGLRRSGGRSEHPLHSTPPTPRGTARGGGKEAPMSIGRPVNASDVARPSPLKARLKQPKTRKNKGGPDPADHQLLQITPSPYAVVPAKRGRSRLN